MRLVKKTVNQDDVSAYHLFYADGWLAGHRPHVLRLARGARAARHASIVRTGLRVAGEDALHWWSDGSSEPASRTARSWSATAAELDFEDPEGQRLSLVDDDGAGEAHPWEKSPVPAEHQIRGLGPITHQRAGPRADRTVLTEVMGMRRVRDYPLPTAGGHVHVYEMGEGGPAAELHVAVEPGPAAARSRRGRRAPRRVPRADVESTTWTERLSRAASPKAGRSTASTSGASTSASPTASSSSSPPTGRGFRRMSRWRPSASGSRCPRSSSRGGRRSRRA